jgi:hypothetical protein
MTILTLTPNAQLTKSFDEQVKAGYSDYTILYDEQKNDFSLKIIQGINSGKVTYGVMFFSEQAKSHELIIEVNDLAYRIPSNDRGDYLAPAITLKEDVTIKVIDDNKTVRYSRVINQMTTEAFKANHTNRFNGDGTGIDAISIKRNFNMSSLNVLYIIFGGVVIIFGLIILILLITKKGMFNRDKRVHGVITMQEYARSFEASMVHEEEPLNVDHDFIIRNVDNDVEEEPQIVNMYPFQREYDDDDDAEDVSEMLRSKGYKTDYETATEEEKNDIMLELMKLRDFRDITKNQYQQEVIKLWKK